MMGFGGHVHDRAMISLVLAVVHVVIARISTCLHLLHIGVCSGTHLACTVHALLRICTYIKCV